MSDWLFPLSDDAVALIREAMDKHEPISIVTSKGVVHNLVVREFRPHTKHSEPLTLVLMSTKPHYRL